MIFSLAIFSLLAAAEAILLPNVTGPYDVAMQVEAMTYVRTDAFYAPNTEHNRELLTSIFWPVDDSESCSHVRVPYFPPATAEHFAGLFAAENNLTGTAASQQIKDTLSSLELDVCEVSKSSDCGSSASAPRYPLALFSPGLGSSRLEYSVIARSIASQGYVVVTVDHPYDSSIIEFSDTCIIRGIPIDDNNEDIVKQVVKVRQDDLVFVLDHLQYGLTLSPRLQEVANKIDFGRVVAFGHSLGGVAAASAMMVDHRIRAGVNMDGGMREPVLSNGIDGAFLLLGQADRQSKDTQHTWSKFWETMRGPKAELEVFGTLHQSFTDLALVIDTLGLPAPYKARLAEKKLGTISGERLGMILTDTLTSFFDIVTIGSTTHFKETVEEYSEIFAVCVSVD